MQSKSALKSRKINNFVEIWCLVALGGYKFSLSWISYQKSNISCPQQPLTEKVIISIKNWNFDDLFHKNGPVLVILVPRIIEPSGLIFWWNEAVEVIEAAEVVEAVEVTEAAEVLRPEKSLLRTSELTRFSNSALFWCFETKFILVESWNIKLNLSAC